MTSIIGKYNGNPVLFNSMKILRNSTSYIRNLMDTFHSEKKEIDELYRNPNYIWINRLKIDLGRNLTIEKAPNGEYPRIRKLDVTVDKDSYDHFDSVIRSLYFLEELDIVINEDALCPLLSEIDISVFPRSLRVLKISNFNGPIKFMIRHPSIESIYIGDIKSSIIDIDGCPRLVNFSAYYSKNNKIICTRERIFETFCIECGFEQEICNSIVVYDEKSETLRSAFDIDNVNEIYNESGESPFTYATDKWTTIYETNGIDAEFYRRRPGIKRIDFRNDRFVEVDTNLECHKEIKIVQCHPIQLNSLIYFKNLERVNIYCNHNSSGDYEIFFQKHARVKIFFIHRGSIIYDECFEKFMDRFEFDGVPEFIVSEQNANSCLKFCDMMKFDDFRIGGPVCGLNINGDKFNYMRSKTKAFFTKKPFPYISITHCMNITDDSHLLDCNCNFLVVENSWFGIADISFFDKVVLVNCTILNNIICSPDFEMIDCRNATKSNTMIIGEKNTRFVMKNTKKKLEKAILSIPLTCCNLKEFLVDGYITKLADSIISFNTTGF